MYNLLNEKIIISIIIPIYNAERYLQICLNSIVTQDFNNYELLLINDGSSDNSGIICDNYAHKYNNIKVFHKENGGVSSARNIGLKAAQGKWITFVDADDYLLPGALTLLHNIALSSKSDVILANTLRLQKEQLSPFHHIKETTTANVVVSLQQFSVWGYVFRTEIIKKKHLQFTEGLAYSEDRVFIYQFSLQAQTITYCNTPVYVYRIHSDSVCQSSNAVRKAYHHFWAAYQFEIIKKNYKANKKIYLKLNREKKKVVKLGLYLFASLSFTKTDYVTIEKQYFNFFEKNLINKIIFSIFFIQQYLLAKRRKIITFRK